MDHLYRRDRQGRTGKARSEDWTLPGGGPADILPRGGQPGNTQYGWWTPLISALSPRGPLTYPRPQDYPELRAASPYGWSRKPVRGGFPPILTEPENALSPAVRLLWNGGRGPVLRTKPNPALGDPAGQFPAGNIGRAGSDGDGAALGGRFFTRREKSGSRSS